MHRVVGFYIEPLRALREGQTEKGEHLGVFNQQVFVP